MADEVLWKMLMTLLVKTDFDEEFTKNAFSTGSI